MSGSKSGEICCWNPKKGELEGSPLTVKSLLLGIGPVVLVQCPYALVCYLLPLSFTFFLGSQEMDYWYLVGTSPP